jgi:hypothetical protein
MPSGWRGGQNGYACSGSRSPLSFLGPDAEDRDSWFGCLGAFTEAKYFLKNCPDTKMDGNNDGTPCEQQWCTSPFVK